MPMIPWGEYRPDVSNYRGKHTQRIENVVPQVDGYGPVNALTAYTDALPAECRGAFVALKSDGTVDIFAGTSTNLYRLDKTDLSWDEVSKTTDAYSVPTDDQWSFRQFGGVVIAANVNVKIQSFTLASSSVFADIAAAPQARYLSVIGPHLTASGISGNETRVQWSAENDITAWTSGTNRAGQQDFADGGIVRGVAGGEFSGVVFQDSAIRRMLYQPGSPLVFSFDRVASNRGLFAPYTLASDDSRVFFLSDQGFEMLEAGASVPTPIGKERVNRTFFKDWDDSEPRVALGVIDPAKSHFICFYKSIAGSAGEFDKAFVYDWDLNRWGRITGISGQYVTALAQPGTSLEALDAQFPSIDAMVLSLDDIPLAFAAELSVADGDNKLGFLRGDVLEAIFESAEFGGDSRSQAITAVQPITDADSVFGQVLSRARLADTATATTEIAMNAFGVIPLRRAGRNLKIRNRIPAATDWTFSTGVEPVAQRMGER